MTQPEDSSPQDEAGTQEPADGGNNSDEGVAIPMNLTLRRKTTNNSSKDSEGGGSSSSNGVGGNNSDNSALFSLGNTSFGFNFDSEEGNSTPPSSERNGESDSDGGTGNNSDAAKAHSSSGRRSSDERQEMKQTQINQEEAELNTITSDSSNNQDERPAKSKRKHQQQSSDSDRKSSSSLTTSSLSSSDGAAGTTSPIEGAAATTSHNMAADAAVANLHSIASAFVNRESKDDSKIPSLAPSSGDCDANDRTDNDSNGGYNTDDEGDRGLERKIAASKYPSLSAPQPVGSSTVMTDSNSMNPAANDDANDDDDEPPKKKKKGGGDNKRQERNAREKERSFRISKQINELRALLSTGGVIVPKGTKSSVLTEAANYIRMLQQHQYRSEIDRHQLVQQIQVIGSGAHGPQASQAIRHAAATNGVWSLGNFGGIPPKSAMGYYAPGSNEESSEMKVPVDPMQQTKIEEHEYRSVFSNCAVGMAIASMGGAFIDCNNLFCQLSNYSKQEVCAQTIFNLTSRQDLQHAFDLISQMISPPMEAAPTAGAGGQQPIVLRGAMNNGNDLGLGVAIVKGEDGIAKFFCVTLIRNPASPFDESRPIPATIELIQGTPSQSPARQEMVKDGAPAGMDSAPAFTTG